MRNTIGGRWVHVFLVICAVVCCSQGTGSAAEETEAYSGFTLGIDKLPYIDDGLTKFQEASPIDIELGSTVVSEYIWRGQRLGGDTSFQPWIKVSPDFEPLGNLSGTIWWNITQDEPSNNNTEQDYIVDYNFDVVKALNLAGYDEKDKPLAAKLIDLNLATGYIYYNFPVSPRSKSQEVYFGATYNWLLHPSFFVYHDWDRGQGSWLEWGLSQDWDLKAFTLSTYAKMGYNHEQWGQSSALSTLDMGVGIPIPLGSHMTMKPFLNYTKRLHPTYANYDDSGVRADLTHDEIYGGCSFVLNF